MVGLDSTLGVWDPNKSRPIGGGNFWDEIPRNPANHLNKMIALSMPRRPSGVVLFTHQQRYCGGVYKRSGLSGL